MIEQPTLPSCPACLNIARRRGVMVGQVVPAGRIVGITHVDRAPIQALVYTDEGFITPFDLDAVVGVARFGPDQTMPAVRR